MKIAVLMTVYNRKEKTIQCLRALQETWRPFANQIDLDVFITDDASTDGTSQAVLAEHLPFPIHILEGTGQLFWNGGMILAWQAAIEAGGYDGYLWLNNDTYVLPEFWQDLMDTDTFSMDHYGKKGIYVGSTKDGTTGQLTYGGFDFINKWTLKDRFVHPDGEHIQSCEAAHGNITYVSSDVVDRMGILSKRYRHGGSDHDYTYLAHKAGFPILVCPHFCAICDNDHSGKYKKLESLSLKERLHVFWSPFGLNMHNALLFNWRCFPYRLPIVLLAGIAKCISPMKSFNVLSGMK